MAHPALSVLQECSLSHITVSDLASYSLIHTKIQTNWQMQESIGTRFSICGRFADFALFCARFARFCGTFSPPFFPQISAMISKC